MSTKYFTPEVRFDANYILDYNHPTLSLIHILTDNLEGTAQFLSFGDFSTADVYKRQDQGSGIRGPALRSRRM